MMGKRNEYAEWRKANPEPDLQALAAKYGGLGKVPREAWAEFDREREDWLSRYRARPIGQKLAPSRRS